MVTVYLLHFSGKYHHCKHYIGGTTRTAEERMQEHISGRGNGLVFAVIKAGLQITIARIWENAGWDKEKELKKQKTVPGFVLFVKKKRKNLLDLYFEMYYYLQ